MEKLHDLYDTLREAREKRSGVPRGDEGWEAELYGEGTEGNEVSKAASPGNGAGCIGTRPRFQGEADCGVRLS